MVDIEGRVREEVRRSKRKRLKRGKEERRRMR